MNKTAIVAMMVANMIITTAEVINIMKIRSTVDNNNFDDDNVLSVVLGLCVNDQEICCIVDSAYYCILKIITNHDNSLIILYNN